MGPRRSHRTGMADTVIDATAHPGEGTGFVSDQPTPEALVEACDHAAAARPAGRRDARASRMGVDFDWVTTRGPATSPRTSEPSRSDATSWRASLELRERGGRLDRGSAAARAPGIVIRRSALISAANAGSARPAGTQWSPSRRARPKPGCRRPVREICEATVPVPVVEQDGPGSRLVQPGQRLGLGAHVAVTPVRSAARTARNAASMSS